MLRESCTVQKKVTAVSKRLGNMDMVVVKLQFRNHVDLWWKPNCNPHDQNELREVSVCLNLCVHLYTDMVWLFWGEWWGVNM